MLKCTLAAIILAAASALPVFAQDAMMRNATTAR